MLALPQLGIAQVLSGRPDSAVNTLERAAALYPQSSYFQTHLLYAYAAAGKWDQAERLRAGLHTRTGSSARVDAATADMIMGNKQPLLALLLTRSGQVEWYQANVGFGCNPLLDPLWSEATFRAAMEALGVQACPARPWPLKPSRL